LSFCWGPNVFTPWRFRRFCHVLSIFHGQGILTYRMQSPSFQGGVSSSFSFKTLSRIHVQSIWGIRGVPEKANM
jgi:hypothetical protein